jgi:hypothetical protein
MDRGSPSQMSEVGPTFTFRRSTNVGPEALNRAQLFVPGVPEDVAAMCFVETRTPALVMDPGVDHSRAVQRAAHLRQA